MPQPPQDRNYSHELTGPARVSLTLNRATALFSVAQMQSPRHVAFLLNFFSMAWNPNGRCSIYYNICTSGCLFSCCLPHSEWLQEDMQSQQNVNSCTGSSHWEPPCQLVCAVSQMGKAMCHTEDIWKNPRVPILEPFSGQSTLYPNCSHYRNQLQACCLRSQEPHLPLLFEGIVCLLQGYSPKNILHMPFLVTNKWLLFHDDLSSVQDFLSNPRSSLLRKHFRGDWSID